MGGGEVKRRVGNKRREKGRIRSEERRERGMMEKSGRQKESERMGE